MQLVDTHCHLIFSDYKSDLDACLERAIAAGVSRIIIPGTDLAKSADAARIAVKYPFIFSAAGIHPHEADRIDIEKSVSELRDLVLENDKVVAIGEVGLDYYRNFSTGSNQKKLFENCILLAERLDLPLILHCRDAESDLLDILKRLNPSNLKGVMHCFSGSPEFLKEVLRLGFFVSFAGNITFEKAARLRDLVKQIPLERLLLETDSPFLSPVPHRGKRNEPAFVRVLVDLYASIYGLEPERIASITTENANQLFYLGLTGKNTIVYKIRDSLYINVTHRCTNRCSFCTRNTSSFVKGYNLALDKDPTRDDIISCLQDISGYKEIVFCGLGEPTLRLGVVRNVAAHIKKLGGVVRLITNGEGSLIKGASIVKLLAGLVDKVSVSINTAERAHYDEICQSVFGEASYDGILGFIRECRASGIGVELTCLDFVGEEVISQLRELATSINVEFRLRKLDVVG